jgi:hypothetical protein
VHQSAFTRGFFCTLHVLSFHGLVWRSRLIADLAVDMSRSFRTPEQALKKAQEKTKSGERVQAVQALHNLLTSVRALLPLGVSC